MNTVGMDPTVLATAIARVSTSDAGTEVKIPPAIKSITTIPVTEILAVTSVDASAAHLSVPPSNERDNTTPWSTLPPKTTIALLSGSATLVFLLLLFSLYLCVTRYNRRAKHRRHEMTPAFTAPQDTASEEYPLDALIASYAAAATPPRPRAHVDAAALLPSSPTSKCDSVRARASLYTASQVEAASKPDSGSLLAEGEDDGTAAGGGLLEQMERKRGYMRRVGIESDED
ncbi:hypothetical protein BC830DRAFT_319575 [Chytriomyces sp. MP71]|nr:hypothetical protein BC830DRAFT_319575 [Chytriomyces sp. MP71]